MRFMLLNVLLFVAQAAGYGGNCKIDGVDSWWSGSVDVPKEILDTDRGIVHTYNTEYITGILEIEDAKYLDAELDGNKLIFRTNDNFPNFENESTRSRTEITVRFNCTEETDYLTFYFKVKDVNNHRPSLNKDVYEYNFEMAIPEEYDLTEFGAISAVDQDFTTEELYFTINDNDDFTLSRGKIENSKTNFARLKARRNIQAPYSRKFTISVSDGGNPQLEVTAPLTITVSNNILSSLEFTQRVYYGNYIEGNTVEMEEPVKIRRGCDNTTVIRQNNYNEYFNVSYNNTKDEIIINNIKPLPKNITMQEVVPLTIEAQTPGKTYARMATVIIRGERDKNCTVEVFHNYYDSTTVMVGLTVGGVFILIVLNAVFLGVWYRVNLKRFGFV